MSPSTPNRGLKRRARTKRRVIFEFHATRKKGPQLIDEVLELLPRAMRYHWDVGASVVSLNGRRNEVLSVRLRLLKKYPDAQVRIFEVPTDAHESWSFAFESDFVLAKDGLTFVIPRRRSTPSSSVGNVRTR